MIAATTLWELERVTFRHPQAEVDTIADVTLAIGAGRVTAILGPNGAGKSTLFQLLLGTLAPERGAVRFKGRALRDWPRRELALDIGAVAQGESEPLFSVREIVAMGRYPHLGPWQRERAADIAAIDAAMARCDVGDLAARWISTLSGGERQGVAIARAIYNNADLIVLDEPTTALSLTETEKVFRFVRTVRAGDRSILFIGHNIHHVYDIAERFVVLDRGRVALNVTKAELGSAEALIKFMEDIAHPAEAAAALFAEKVPS